MRCRRCHSLMAQTHEELNPHSKQSWHKCPVCGRSQLVSEPVSRLAQLAGLSEPQPWTQSPITIEH